MSSEISELKHMVMGFRVAELRALLSAAGRSKSGRKHDLMTRALQMLKNECSPEVRKQIKGLYNSRYPRSNSQFDSIIKPYEANIFAPTAPVRDDIASNSTPHPVKLKFTCMPFYEILNEVIRPCRLVPQKQNSQGYYDTRYAFRLSPEIIDEINRSIIGTNFKTSYQVQVQMRFCAIPNEMDMQLEQKDHLPPTLNVKVNREIVTLPPFLPPTKAGQEPKRANRAIDITEHCKMFGQAENLIDVSWMSSSKYNNQDYAMVLNVVRKRNHLNLLNKLKKNKLRNAGHSRALIQDKLICDPDSEITATSLKVSLLCPLGKMRMITPGRSLTCTHIQCFDLSTFLQMNEKRPTWMCPVCNKPSVYKNLIIDELFVDVLKQTSHNEIIFSSDGSWEAIKEKVKPEPKSKIEESVISSSDENSMEGDDVEPVKTKSKKSSTVIDLTLDSSDDEIEDYNMASPCKNNDKFKKSCSYSSSRESNNNIERSYSSSRKHDTGSVYTPPPSFLLPNERGTPSSRSLSHGSNNNSPAPGAIGSLLNMPPSMMDPLDFTSPLFNHYRLGGLPYHGHETRLYQEMVLGRGLFNPTSISPNNSLNEILHPYPSYSPLPSYLFPPSTNSNSSTHDDILTIE